MKKFTKIALAALTLAASSMASAQLYGAISAGQSNTSFEGSDFTVASAANSSVKDANTFKFAVGYEINPNVAVELGYADLGKAIHRFSGATTGETGLKQSSTTLAVKGTLPLEGPWALTGKLGASFNKSSRETTAGAGIPDVTNNAKDFIVGFGVQYALDKTTAIVAEYEDFGAFGTSSDMNRTRASAATIGLVVKF